MNCFTAVSADEIYYKVSHKRLNMCMLFMAKKSSFDMKIQQSPKTNVFCLHACCLFVCLSNCLYVCVPICCQSSKQTDLINRHIYV